VLCRSRQRTAEAAAAEADLSELPSSIGRAAIIGSALRQPTAQIRHTKVKGVSLKRS